MSNRPLLLNALRAFEAVARLQSVRKAANELHVTPAAVSHQIKLLEDIAGHPLLVRKARGVVLTDMAQAALPRLSAGFEKLVEGARVLNESGGEPTLTVSVAPSFATCWLMPRLHHFLSAQPGVDVRIAAHTRQSAVVRGLAQREAAVWLADADVAVMLSQGTFPGLHAERLIGLTVTPLASPALLRKRKLSLSDLRGLTLIHDDLGWRVDGHDFWDLWLAAAGGERLKLKHGTHFSHTILALDAAVKRMGIVTTLYELARPQIDSGHLVAPFALRAELPYAYYLVAWESAFSRKPVQSFVAWLRQQAAASSGPER